MNETPKYTVLVVDDEPEVREVLQDALEMVGYDAITVADGISMFQVLKKKSVALIILDLRLSAEDGLTLARKVREQSNVPIMMLTGKGSEADRILGLELAADDYLMKPFNVHELVARVHALIRRSTQLNTGSVSYSGEEHSLYFFGDWILDITACELRNKDGKRVDLTYGEYALLEVLVAAPNKVFSRDELLERTRGQGQGDVFDRTIDVQILRIRRKIESNPKSPRFIRTERGVGYVFSSTVKTNK